MAQVSHANPYTGETAGHLFNRGPTVIADGGRADAVNPENGPTYGAGSEGRPAGTVAADGGEQPDDGDRMRDVSHTPPNESDDANRVFERGGRERPTVETDAPDDEHEE